MSTPESIEADAAADAAFEQRWTGECHWCEVSLEADTTYEWMGHDGCLACCSTEASQAAESDTLSGDLMTEAAILVRERADDLKRRAARRCSEENQRLAAATLPTPAQLRAQLYAACRPDVAAEANVANRALHVVLP